MIYDVRQTTSYTYASRVGYAHHVLRLTPIDRTRQRVQAAALEITPAPAGRRDGRDFFGNRLTWIELAEPHDRMTIRVAARIVVDALGEPSPQQTPAWEAVRDDVFATSDIRDYAGESFPPGRPILAGAIDLMCRINDEFVYDAEATTVSTPPPRSFALRRGVCQDFAHVMISGLRGIGLPAAYVSGYLRTVPKSGVPGLQGADAMHAWVWVWCGAAARWYGLDPTNAVLAGDDHLVVAIGRDYSDVAPVGGVVFASGKQQIDEAVSVMPVRVT